MTYALGAYYGAQGALTAMRARRNIRRAQYAGQAVKFAYQNRKRIGASWRATVKAAKKMKRSKIEKRTMKSTGATTRQHGIITPDGNVGVRTLIKQAIQFPIKGTAIGDRLGMSIRMRGIKFCYEFENLNDFDIEMHFALVQFKTSSTVGTNMELGFFRDTTSASNRAKDFVNATVNPTSWEFEYKCFPINRDNMNVVFHKKKIMGVRNRNVSQRYSTRETGWYWKVHRYMKWRRRIPFETTSDQNQPNSLFFIYWWVPVSFSDWNEDPAAAGSIQERHHHVLYFRNGAC